MKTVVMVRHDQSSLGTFGALSIDGTPFCATCENPWLKNKVDVSCIPKGMYECEFTYSSTFKCLLYQVNTVEGRTGIRFHSGNTIEDTEGCVLLGDYFGFINGKKAVMHSRKATARFHRFMNGEPFNLIIVEV